MQITTIWRIYNLRNGAAPAVVVWCQPYVTGLSLRHTRWVADTLRVTPGDDVEAEQVPVPRRLTNVQLISTAGVAPEDLAHCLECARPGSVQLEGRTGVAAVFAS